LSSKIHIGCEGKGKPITFLLSLGQRNESIFLEQRTIFYACEAFGLGIEGLKRRTF